MPITWQPSRSARIVTARIAGFKPGTSPPPVRIPITPFFVFTLPLLFSRMSQGYLYFLSARQNSAASLFIRHFPKRIEPQFNDNLVRSPWSNARPRLAMHNLYLRLAPWFVTLLELLLLTASGRLIFISSRSTSTHRSSLLSVERAFIRLARR